jgi:nucleoside-diphosphate-sugar epimerase
LLVAVTGAGGFVGRHLVRQLDRRGSLGGRDIARILAVDTDLPAPASARVETLRGNITSAAVCGALVDRGPDVVFHLAAIPGGAVAADPALGWRVNVEASVKLMDALAQQRRGARFVAASSIAVFGVPLPSGHVDDDTLPLPTMTYGTHKLIVEAALADFTRRGLIDGVALRLPGIVARPPQKSGHLSAYMSNIFHALAAGESFTAPVSRQARSWFMSLPCCVDNLIHAAELSPGKLGSRRAFTLPALHLSMEELVAGLAAHFGEAVKDRVTYAPDAALEAQFGAYPLLRTPIADAMGFRHDGDATALVARALDLDARQSRGAA